MYKVIVDGKILAFGLEKDEQPNEEYINLTNAVKEKPIPQDGYEYYLRADTLEWELVELPPAPEPSEDEIDDSEALNIILGGAAE